MNEKYLRSLRNITGGGGVNEFSWVSAALDLSLLSHHALCYALTFTLLSLQLYHVTFPNRRTVVHTSSPQEWKYN